MIKLFEHQKLALAYLKMNESFALFLDQGMGKTLIMLTHIKYLLDTGKIKNYLVISPKAPMGAWERDIEKFEPGEQEKLRSAGTLINYDRVWRNDFDKQQFDLIVLDEAHYIKNRSSNRTKACIKLSMKSKYRYILTGTPIGNGALENIWAQYTFLAPIKQGRSIACEWLGKYGEFTDNYCVLNQYYQPYKYRNVSTLQDIINEHSLRLLKENCLDLPDKLPDVIWECELKEKSNYKKLATESAIVELDILAENPLTRMLKLRQLCSGRLVTDDGTIIETKHEKLKVISEFLDDFDKKLVIFCQFKNSIRDLAGLMQKKKIKYVTLDGDQKDKTIWRRFQAEENIKVILVQYESGCAGIDLYSASTMIFYEPTIRSTTLEQARDRIHRNGQTSKCSYIHLITKGSIEQAIYNSLQNYSDFSEKLFTEYIENYQRSYSTK